MSLLLEKLVEVALDQLVSALALSTQVDAFFWALSKLVDAYSTEHTSASLKYL